MIYSEDPQFLVPGALKGDGAKRSLREEIYCNAVKFAPSGELFAAASSQGLMIFSLDPSLAFDPFDLHEDVTPDAVNYALAGEDYGLFVADVFRIMDGKIGRTNTRARYQYLKAQPAEQALAAQYLHSWMNTITADSFG